MKRYLMGLDTGTTSFKAALFDEEKNLAASVTTDYDLLTPGENIVEFPAEAYWKIFCDTAKRLLAKTNVRGEQVEALALSSQGETLIALDARCRPVGKAIVWLDNRAGREADELRERFGREEIYRVTGQADMLATWPAAKIRWLKKNRAEDYRRTAKFLLLEDYLIYRLTGRCVGEPNLWASSAMLDIHMGEWWGEMLRELEISPDRLPELKDCGTRVGSVLPEAAAECGLSPQTQVATGALDQTCNAIGCGLTLPGMICETTGSCLAVSAILDSFVPFDASMQITCQNHAVPGRYTVLLWSQSAGMTHKWFAREFYPECADLDEAFERMNGEMETVPMGCGGVTMLPHITGAANPEYDSNARGVFCGITPGVGRAQFGRAIFEAVACMLRSNIEQLERLGARFDSVYCMGGGAKSPLWLQIKADIAGKDMIPLRARESACLGAAILAGKAIGVYDSIDWKPEELESARPVCANPENKAAAEIVYRKYGELYRALKPWFQFSAENRA